MRESSHKLNCDRARSVAIFPDLVGGEPIIEGTRVPVKTVVLLCHAYSSVDEVLRALPMLTTSDVANALAYYDAHRDAIETFIAADEASDAEPL